MSRIHQILSKAERDGTTAGLTWADPELRDRELPPGVAAFRADPTSATATADRDTPPAPPPVSGATLAGRPLFGVKLHRQLVAAVEPFSAAAEQYRTLRTRIAQLDGTSPRPVLAITSPRRGDGKTLTVLNLALSMAQEFDRRTLLIDADLRNARLHTLLGIAREPGLVDVLSGTTPLEEALVTLPGHRLQVLPAGAAHTQPSELLGSAPMRRLLDGLRRHFDRVVVDTAAAESADTGALEPCLDGLLVVVRAGRTDRGSIERALTAIPPTKLVGLVLNDIRTADSVPGA